MNPEATVLPEAIQGSAPPVEHKCPACGKLLYSHRSLLCASCGAVFPRDRVLTDEQVKAREEERQWARDLADTFAPAGRTPRQHLPRVELSGTEPTEEELAALEASLRRISCVSEFKCRKRHTWVYVVGGLITSLVELGSQVIREGGFAPLNVQAPLLLFSPGLNALLWFLLWRRAMPICPNCKQNIRTCAVRYCYRCGKPTNHQRCAECGVDESWTGRLPFAGLLPFRKGNSGWIACCPGCGVELGTSLVRA